jgi:hypothetical protein
MNGSVCSTGAAGAVDAVRAAVAEGADINRAKALHMALGAGRNDIVDVLLELGADVQFADSVGLTPMHVCASMLAKVEDQASFSAGLQVLKLLLAKGADPTVKTLRGDDAAGVVDESVASMGEMMRVFGMYDAADPTLLLLNENANRIKEVLRGSN